MGFMRKAAWRLIFGIVLVALQSDAQKDSEMVERMTQKWKERAARDKEYYSDEELKEARRLFNTTRSNESEIHDVRHAVNELLEKFPKSIFAGVALFRLALRDETGPDETEEILLRVILEFSDSFMGPNQIGSAARWRLAELYRQQDKERLADRLEDEIIEQYPDAVDFRGKSLVLKIREEREKRNAPGEETPGLPAPESRQVRIGDIRARRIDFDGKVLSVEINMVTSFDQLSPEWSRASCSYYDGGLISSTSVLIPEGGRAFFLEMLRSSGGGGARTVYIRIRSSDPVVIGRSSFYFEAVGTRYSRTGNEYRW